MPSPTSPPPASLRKTTSPDPNSSALSSKRRNLSPASSLASLPYRANPSLSNLYTATASGPKSVRSSGASTPNATESHLSGSTLLSNADGRAVSPVTALVAGSPEARQLIQRGFAPHVAVLASDDLEDMLSAKGFKDGFLELIRPYGEVVSGKVTVRDGIGISRPYEDFGIRFFSIKDALGQPKGHDSSHHMTDSKYHDANGSKLFSAEGKTVGGDISHIEEVVERHLSFAELRPSSQSNIESPTSRIIEDPIPQSLSPFYTLYLRRLLSGLPISPHETFSHPVACIIAISSRSQSPIEEFKKLYASTMNEYRFPSWVNNDYLRYYVLVHDEDHDDISKSTALYEQMKRNFSLECHLLRIRSSQCVPSDDDSVRLPFLEWMSAGEELFAITQREISEDIEDPTPYLHETDSVALKAFVRELVTQSLVPTMERSCATWNETVANRRRGFSGRLMTAARRWTPFSSGKSTSSVSNNANSTNYDALRGVYDPQSPESTMRKLADYAFMLRDFKLAQSTYELLKSDFEHDSAWKHYAGASEMCLISTLMNPTSRTRQDSIDRWLEAARHSYIHRCSAPYYALRTFLVAAECLQYRGSLGVDEPAAWAARTLEMKLPGPIGQALISERISEFFAQKKPTGSARIGSRSRKRGFWSLVAAENWLQLGKSVQAERCLGDSKLAYGIKETDDSSPHWIKARIQELQDDIVQVKLESLGMEDDYASEDVEEVEEVEEISGDLNKGIHRRSVIDLAPLAKSSLDNEGFE